jgi:hypothetical protein
LFSIFFSFLSDKTAHGCVPCLSALFILGKGTKLRECIRKGLQTDRLRLQSVTKVAAFLVSTFHNLFHTKKGSVPLALTGPVRTDLMMRLLTE